MANQKILLIEDDEILGKVMSEELKDAGFQIQWVLDGEAGIKAVQSTMPDLVLLDLMLPKKHGFDVLSDIKSSPATAGIPVIIMTMMGQDDDIKKGIQLGAVDYIVKSQHAIAEIVEKIKTFFSKEQHPTGKES